MLNLNIPKSSSPVGVAISGGLDSTVVLHHLVEAGNFPHSYTMKWGKDGREADAAKRIAAHYRSTHTIVEFTRSRYWRTLDKCMEFFDKPRWNVWPYMILESASANGIKDFYIGEGCDEVFGYQDRCYLRGWIDLLEYHFPPWLQSAAHFNITLHAPFMELEKSLETNSGLPTTLPLHCGIYKEDLWKKYHKLVPSDLVTYPKTTGTPMYYHILGMSKEQLQKEATKRWLSMR